MEAKEYLDNLIALYEQVDMDLPLRPGASEADIAEVQKRVALPLPAQLSALWKRTNGVASEATFFAVISDQLTNCDFLSTQEAIEYWLEQCRADSSFEGFVQRSPRDPRIKANWGHPGWLPFAQTNGGGTLIMLDTFPETGGVPGQVIVYQHDPDAIYYVAERFAEFLSIAASLLKENIEELV